MYYFALFYRIINTGDRHNLLTNITLIEWTHLTIVYRGVNDPLSLYVNGDLITPVSNSVDTSLVLPADTDTSGQFAIGSGFTSVLANEVTGNFLLDELVMWDAVLADDQVSQLYNA